MFIKKYICSIGRKTTLVIGAVPITIGWIIMIFADSVIWLYIARFLTGITDGLVFTNVAPIYLGEIASDKVRGSISIISTVMGAFGILLFFAIAPYVSLKTMSGLGLITPILFFIACIYLPESPYFLLGKNRHEDAFNALVKLRGHKNVEAELKMMEAAVQKSDSHKVTYKDLFLKGNRRSLIIILGLAGALQVTGCEVLLVYSEVIFNKIDANFLGPSEVNIIFGFVMFVTSALASMLVDRLGRKPLLIFSFAGLALCNGTVAVFFLFKRFEYDVSNVAWIPVTALMGFIACYGMGTGPVTFTLLGEIFQKNMKAFAGAAFSLSFALVGFASVKLFQVISDEVGSDWAFMGFSVFALLYIPFVYFLVPETKGKPLDQILEELNGNKSDT